MPFVLPDILINPAVPKPEHCVQGTTHQLLVGNETSRGKQCTPIATVAIAVATLFHPQEWQPNRIDDLLVIGDHFYRQVAAKMNIQGYLRPDDVPTIYYIDDYFVNLSIGEPLNGTHHHPQLNLVSCLQEVLTGDAFCASLLVAFERTVAIWKLKGCNKFWIFDSHSRDENGKSISEGKARCARYSSIADVCSAIYQNHRDETNTVLNVEFNLWPVTFPSSGGILKFDRICLPGIPEETYEQENHSQRLPLRRQRFQRKKQRIQRKKQRLQRRRRWKRVECILMNAGVDVPKNASPTERALADKCRLLHDIAKEIFESRRRLKEDNLRLQNQSIRDFLSKRGVSEHVIQIAECDSKNRPKNPRGYRFKPADIARAVSLKQAGGSRALSVAHQHFINPSARTSRKTIQKIVMKNGIEDNPFLGQIRHMVCREDQHFKFITITFDETQVRRNLTPRESQGIIVGYEDFGSGDRTAKIANKAFVVHVQGLLLEWSFPLAVMHASGAANKDKLATIIPAAVRGARNLGLHVLIVGCDQAPTNVSAIDTLMSRHPVLENGEASKCMFAVDGEGVIAIYDAAHMAKTLRNALLGGEGLNAVTGSIEWPISEHGEEVMHEFIFDTMDKLKVALDSSNSSFATKKLTAHHLAPVGRAKMKVSFATQVLSETNAGLLESIGDDNLEGASLAAKVVRDLDTLIDLTIGHSSRERDVKEARKPMSSTSLHMQLFPVYLDKLGKAEIFSYIKTRGKTVKRKSKSFFLKTMTQTIRGLLALHSKLIAMNVHCEVNIRQTTSDLIESLFRGVKSQGGNNPLPTCDQFNAQIKTFCIQGMVVAKSTSGNTQDSGRNAHETLLAFIDSNNNHAHDDTVPNQGCHAVMEETTETEEQVDDICAIPVLSLSDEDQQTPSSVPSQLPVGITSFDAVQVALKLKRRLLGKHPCATCRKDMTAESPEPVHSVAVRCHPRLTSGGLPSLKLVNFVSCGQLVFEGLRGMLHETDVFSKVNMELTAHLDTTWITCEDHVSKLFKSFVSLLIEEFCRLHNDALKPASKKSHCQRDSDVLSVAMSGIAFDQDESSCQRESDIAGVAMSGIDVNQGDSSCQHDSDILSRAMAGIDFDQEDSSCQHDSDILSRAMAGIDFNCDEST
jgi:hypothetical protein